MEDIGDATSVATSQPADAAANISNANLFSVDPRYAAQNKDTFDQKASQILKPQQAEAPVADYMKQSSEHTALAVPDVDKLNFMSRQAKAISDYVYDRPTTNQTIVDLNLKRMNNGGNLDSDDDIKLQAANQDAQDQSTRDYGFTNPIEKIPSFLAGAVTDFGQSVVRGARKGLLEGPLGNLPPSFLSHHPLLAGAGLYYGVMVKDPYDQLSAGTYNELSNLKGDDGQPKNLDHDTKLAMSRAVGVIGTTLMNGAGLAVAETAPFLKPFMNPALASGLINTPAKAAIMVSLGNALKGSTAVAAASGFTEVAKIVAEEIGKNKGTDEAGFWNSLATAATKANAVRVGSATGQGFALGAAMELPLQVAGFGRIKQNFEQGFGQHLRDMPASRDVTPEALKALPGAGETAHPDIDVTPDIGGGSPGTGLEKSFKSIHLNEALHQINDVQKSTQMEQLAPGELNEVNKQNFAAAGISKVWSTVDSLKEWASSDEKLAAVKKIMNVPESQINAPLSMDTHEVMEIAKKYPDILDHVSADADSPNGLQAKEHVEALNRAEEQRQELMTKLGIKPEEVAPESNVTELKQPAKEEKIPYDIHADVQRTQQILDALKTLKEQQEQFPARQTEEGNVASIDSKKTKEIDDNLAASQATLKAKLEAQLAEVKERVTGAMKENPPGTVMSFPYDEAKAAQKAELAYGRAPTFTEAIQKVLPPEAVAKYNASQLSARQNVAEQVHDAAVHEMNKVIDQHVAMAQEDAYRGELERIAHDPNYAIVDKFHSHQIANAKGKNKRSMYAIDPSTLPKELVHFADNAQLKAHKVFAKGASSAEDSARALGFSHAQDLLDVLSTTPTREQVIKARSQFYTSDIERLAQAGVDLDHTNIMKAFTERTAAHLSEMKFMREQEWPSTKYGFKKIALPLPRMEDIEHDSHAAVRAMKIGDLSPAQYLVGERQSQKIAIHAILNNEVEKAFVAKEAAARNASMQKEVRKGIAEVNRAQKFFRKLEEPTAQAILKTAGKTARNAIDEITDLFNFNPKRKNQSELNSFNKWVRKEVESGRGDFSIPDRLSDIRKSFNEMTVEQALVAFDRAKTIFNEARFKAELIRNRRISEAKGSVDRIAEAVMKAADVHPSSSESNFKDIQGNDTKFGALKLFMQTSQTAFSNMEHILRFYDQGKFNGFFQETFMHQLKGDGVFDKVSGYSKENKMIEDFAHNARKIMENHGSYDKVEKIKLNIPEFANVPSLSRGRLTKGDLMTLWAYKGDPDGRAKLVSNHKDTDGKTIALETWQKVFDRELTKADVYAMQYSVDMYKGYQDETRDLQQRTKGEDVTFVKGVPNEHRGEFLPGGYVPIKYKHEWSTEAAKRALQVIEDKRAAFFEKDDGAEFGKQFASEQTEQGRLIERTDSDKPLDASLIRFWRGHEEAIHDISYRESVMNNLKLLKDSRIREAMIRMGGEARYNLLVNTVIEMAGRAEAMNANYFSDQNRFMKDMFNRLQNNFNVTVLGANIFTSTPIQYESLTQLFQNMGAKGLPHFANVNRKMAQNPHLAAGFYNFANELDPTIGHFMDQLQNKITSQVHDIIPMKNQNPITKALPVPHKLSSLAEGAYDWAVHIAMSPMALADIHLKVMGAMAGYAQFMAGHADNFPLEKIQAMPEAEQHAQAQAYVRQLSRLSLTHGRPEDKAPLQKSPITYFFSNYWNDARNVLNNQIQQAQKTSWALKAGNQALGQGSGSGSKEKIFGEQGKGRGMDAAGYFGTAGAVAMATIIYATAARWYSDKLRGIQQTPDQWNLDLKTAEGRKDAAEQMGNYMMLSPADQFASVQPVLRETFFAEQMPDKVIRGYVDKAKTVQIPITKMLSDIATAGNTLTDAVQQAHNMTDFLRYVTNLDNKETKALLNAESYIGIPIPVNAYSHLMRILNLPLNAPTQIGPAAFEALSGASGAFLKKQSGPDKLDISPDFHAQVEKMHQDLAPIVVKVPDGMEDTMKYAMSNADWSKPNGIYGFSKEQWSTIQKAAPDLGLTEQGRISKDLEQQERAMDYSLHEMAHTLAEKDIPSSPAALYSSFRLGVDKYEALYKAPSDAKIKTVLGADVIEKNPDLSQFKTVGQVKIYLNNQAEKAAQQAHAKTAQLTQTTNKAED